jgi:outer membrane lipoprotein-sorting protein
MQPNVRRVRTNPAGKPTMGSVFISCAAAAVVLTGWSAQPAIAQATKTVSAAVQPAPATAPPLLEAFARAWNDVTAYSATVTVFSAKGADAQNIVFDYTFRKPSSFIVHVVAGPNAGVTLTWNGGPTVQASRGRGLFSLLKRTIPLHDPLVTTVRAESIDQLSYGAILAHAEQTPGMLAQSPGESIAGTPTQALSLVPSDPAADAGLSREVIEISTATALPIRIEGYEGHTLVRKIDFSDVQPEK